MIVEAGLDQTATFSLAKVKSYVMRYFRRTRKGQDLNPELPRSVPVLLLQDQASFVIIALVLMSATVNLEGGK